MSRRRQTWLLKTPKRVALGIFRGFRRVQACRRAPLKGVFRHRHQRKSCSRWPSDASSVASSTLLASHDPADHVLRFRSTWSADPSGHRSTMCSVEDRELILLDESSRSYLRAAGTSGRPERDFADRQSATNLKFFVAVLT